MDGIRIIEDAAVCAVGADSLGGIPPPAEAGVRVVARVSHRAAADAADAGLTLCEDETIQSLGFTYFHAFLCVFSFPERRGTFRDIYVCRR